jgi:hypothetical protein
LLGTERAKLIDYRCEENWENPDAKRTQ